MDKRAIAPKMLPDAGDLQAQASECTPSELVGFNIMRMDTTQINPEQAVLDSIANSGRRNPVVGSLHHLDDIWAYATEGQLNAVANIYKDYSLESVQRGSQNWKIQFFLSLCLKRALKVCAKEGWLSSISTLINSGGVPRPIAGRIASAVFRAMRVCVHRNDSAEIATFLKTSNSGERICSKGISHLVRMGAFRKISMLLDEGCTLPEGAKQKAERVCLKNKRSIMGQGVFSRFFKRKPRPKPANSAPLPPIARISKRG